MTPPTHQKEGWEEEFIERGAALEHARWARWYVYEKQNWSLENEARWDRQAKTAYVDLTEREKESDRREVREYLPLIESLLKEREALAYSEGRTDETWWWRLAIVHLDAAQRNSVLDVYEELKARGKESKDIPQALHEVDKQVGRAVRRLD